MTYVEFVRQPQVPGRKTGTWKVGSPTSGTHLGSIRFYPRWRCFTFYPEPGTLFNEGCLRDIARFCEAQTGAWRRGAKARS